MELALNTFILFCVWLTCSFHKSKIIKEEIKATEAGIIIVEGLNG